MRQIFKDAVLVAFEGNKKISIAEAKAKESQPKPQVAKPEEAPQNNITFRIQVFSSRNEVPKDNYDMRRAQKYEPVTYYTENGWYKYTCTETTSYDKAKENLKTVQATFKDAVIVAFKNNKKISINEAIEKK